MTENPQAINEKLQAIYDFGLYLLDLSPQQRVSFLAQIRRNQCKFIRQAATNILLNSSILLTSVDREYFRKKKRALRLLGSKGICLDQQRYLLPKYSGLVRRLMLTTVRYIGPLLTGDLTSNDE